MLTVQHFKTIFSVFPFPSELFVQNLKQKGFGISTPDCPEFETPALTLFGRLCVETNRLYVHFDNGAKPAGLSVLSIPVSLSMFYSTAVLKAKGY